MSEDESALAVAPLSVWAAAALLIGPPLGVSIFVVCFTGDSEVVWAPGVWLLMAVVNAARLVKGHPSGITWAAVLLGFLALFPIAMIAGLALGGVNRDLLWAALPFGYLLTVAALLWWPATRMWCGWLDPDPYGEFDND